MITVSPKRGHHTKDTGNRRLWKAFEPFDIGEPSNTKLVRKVFLEINVQFGTLAILNKIITRVCSEFLAPSVSDFLQGLGWVVLVGEA